MSTCRWCGAYRHLGAEGWHHANGSPACTGEPDVAGHESDRQLVERAWYPEHGQRSASKEYTRVHHHLVYELDEPCWVCGVRRSTGGKMETHHSKVEWALANRIDASKLIADFPELLGADDPHLRQWLDSEGNMLVLCDRHHRWKYLGIHMTTYPIWVAQRWLHDGQSIDKPDA